MKKYTTVLFAGALSACVIVGGANIGSIGEGVIHAEESTNRFVSKEETQSDVTGASTTEEVTTEGTTATSTTESKTTEGTESATTTAAKKTKTKKKIKTKNKVKRLKKEKLKEEKVTNNIIPKVYNDTRLSMKDSKEMIGRFIYFNQGDIAWNQNGYCIKSAGCGPTAMAVCISSLTGQWVTPLDTTIWAYNNGYYTNAGSSHDMIPALAQQYKLTCNGLGTDYEGIKKSLQAGNPVVALMGPGYFTKGGHFIVLVDIDDKDQVTVADVGSRERSTYKYLLQDVIGQSKAAAAGGPFWEISAPMKEEKKAEVKKATKEEMEFEYHCKDLRSVLQYGYEISVPMTKGKISTKNRFITLTGIDNKDEVSVQGTDAKVHLADVVKELNMEALHGTFWEMVHPMQKNQGPTMSDYLFR